jgi:hypothetical protein
MFRGRQERRETKNIQAEDRRDDSEYMQNGQVETGIGQEWAGGGRKQAGMGKRQAGIAKNMKEVKGGKSSAREMQKWGGGHRRNEIEEAGTGRNGQGGCRRQKGMDRRKQALGRQESRKGWERKGVAIGEIQAGKAMKGGRQADMGMQEEAGRQDGIFGKERFI